MKPLTDGARYQAFASRDLRYDGAFYVGVTSTGIYCRPVCPARKPRQANCRFFDNREAAEAAGFRACVRCRPELAPGVAPMDDAQRIARQIVQRLEQAILPNDAGIEDIAAQFELSARQIRRIIRAEMGVSPTAFLVARRLLLAKQLLTETHRPVTDVAFACGFSSVRRFNDAFRKHYGMPPRVFRMTAQPL